jgi:hypothetical protein
VLRSRLNILKAFFSSCLTSLDSVLFFFLGVILTMKKVIACQAEQEHFAETIEALEKLFLDIGSCDVKPKGHENKIKEILAIPVKKKSMSDDEMLKELNKLSEEEEK